jgi:hypothetical protein
MKFSIAAGSVLIGIFAMFNSLNILASATF